jgi:transposase
MYLKKSVRRKGGERYESWALVESVRTQRGPRQRTVATLGKVPGLDEEERVGWEEIGRILDGKPRRETDLFRPAEPEPPEWARVDLARVRVERLRHFGDVYLGLALWRRLGLHLFFDAVMEEGREEIGWSLVACVLALGRFCAPSSELRISESWYQKTALEDLLGIAGEKINDDRLYRALDAMLPHRDELFRHLQRRYGEWFGVKYDLLLYDVTSTYFEGECKRNGRARRGYSRDHRPDCLQVCIGLVVSREGLPLAYEVFDGNRSDVTTLEEIVEWMEGKYGKAGRIWVLDRGMVREENLEFLRSRGTQYIVCTPKAMLKKFEHELLEKEWREVEPGVEIKLLSGPEGSQERFVVCRSAGRAEKEKAILDRFMSRLEAGLKRLRERAEKGNLRRVDLAWQSVGRLKERYWRASSLFDVRISETADREHPRKRKLRIEYAMREERRAWAGLSEGMYLVRTNLKDRDGEELWRAYTQLAQAEAAFRTLKSELGLRPIFHQKTNRVEAHIMVCFLGLAMRKTLEQWMAACGLGTAPRTLIEELREVRQLDVVLPDVHRKEIRLRVVSTPEKRLRILLHKLGLPLPNRPRNITKCSGDFRPFGNVTSIKSNTISSKLRNLG